MGNNIKVLIGEINGQELDQQEEYVIQLDDMPTVDTSTVPPSVGDKLEWNGTNWVPSAGSGSGNVKFGSNSTAGSGKWLEIHRNITSNEVPFVVCETSTLTCITARLKNTDTVTFGVYKNGSQIDTIILTAENKKTKIISHALATNDELSIKIESGQAQDPIVHLFF